MKFKIEKLLPALPRLLTEQMDSLLKDVMSHLIAVEAWPEQGLILPRLQAHRGSCNDGAQENTLMSFRAAKKKGALMVECDVQLSKDRIPILFHDYDLQRLAGISKKVSQCTRDELRDLVKAPSLKELLTDSESPRFVNIELKSRARFDDPLERKVAEVVKEVRAENRVLFSSFNPFSIYRISLYLPDVPRALLVTDKEDEDNHFLLRKMLLAPLISFHCLNLDQDMVNETSLKIWKERKIPVVLWTVNGAANIQKFLKMGAISVITDTIV